MSQSEGMDLYSREFALSAGEGSLLGVTVLDVVAHGGRMRTRHVAQRTLVVVHCTMKNNVKRIKECSHVTIFSLIFKSLISVRYGLFPLLDSDSDSESHSDSKPYGYIVLCKTCFHCTDSDSDPYFLFLYRTGIVV